jgi:hypothetical protein
MRNTDHIRIKLAAAALAAAPAVLAPQAQAQLASLPLPVTTNVTVTNPSIPVTGSVSVSNSTLNVHSVDNHALNAFTTTGQGPCTTSQQAVFGIPTPGSSNGEVLVLEQVSVHFKMRPGTFPAFGVRIQAQGSSGPYVTTIPATLQGSDAFWNFYVASQAVKTYSIGTSVAAMIDEGATSSGSANDICIDEFSISGYTVPNH